jgi:hypothetical protein
MKGNSRLLLASAVLTLLPLMVACDPGESLRVENHTAQTVYVFQNDELLRELAPGEKARLAVLRYEGVHRFSVRDGRELVLAEAELAWEEFQAQDGLDWEIE